jgi:PAS domain S-box-containing protein
MMSYRHLGLLTKVNIIIAVTMVSFFCLSTYISYRQQRDFIIEEAVEKARIVAFEAIRSREYLSSQLATADIELNLDRYGLIPVVASQRIGQRVGEDLDYLVRQTSLRYRNPNNAPDLYEQQTLERFIQNPALKELYEVGEIDDEPVFRYLTPFVSDQSCLQCHGDPEAAPEFIKKLFPPDTDKAYNYQIGQVIGAASVTIPMERLSEQIAANVRNDVIYLGGIFLALITCLGLLLRVAVTGPLGRLGLVIGRILETGRFEEHIPRKGRDEIGRLIDGFNEMMDHLQEKTAGLEESERRFRVLTDTARDGIVSFVPGGQIILFNRQAERIFGYSKAEMLGFDVVQLVHPDCSSLAGVELEAYFEQRGDDLFNQVLCLPCRRRDGSRVDLELSLSVAESDGHRFYTAILREGH